MREDRTDIALTFSYPGDRDDPHGSSARGLSVNTVGADELLAVLPARPPRGRPATALDVRCSPTRTGSRGAPAAAVTCSSCARRAGFAPRIAFETDNFVAVEGLVAQGIGVATLPRMAVESFPQLPGVAIVPLPAGEQRTHPRRHCATGRPRARDPRDAGRAGAPDRHDRRPRRGGCLPQSGTAGRRGFAN